MAIDKYAIKIRNAKIGKTEIGFVAEFTQDQGAVLPSMKPILNLPISLHIRDSRGITQYHIPTEFIPSLNQDQFSFYHKLKSEHWVGARNSIANLQLLIQPGFQNSNIFISSENGYYHPNLAIITLENTSDTLAPDNYPPPYLTDLSKIDVPKDDESLFFSKIN